jgi:hypothetical protein
VQRRALRSSRLLHGLRGAVRRLVADDSGMALIVAVVMLVALTVIGIAALTMTNVGLKMAAGEKAFNVALYNADAGVSITAEVLEQAILFRWPPVKVAFKTSGGPIFVNDDGFWNEDMVFDPASVAGAGLTRTYVTWPYDYYDDQNTHRPVYGQAAHNHDEEGDAYDLKYEVPLGNGAAAKGRVDVDYLQMEETPGSSTLAGMGYDGQARGVAGGGARRVYGFAVRGDGPALTNSKVRVAVTYDHVL